MLLPGRCEKCGRSIYFSPKYLTDPKAKAGEYLPKKCLNCGHLNEPKSELEGRRVLNKIKPLWVVVYFNEKDLIEEETKLGAVRHFVADYVKKHKGLFNVKAMREAILTGTPRLLEPDEYGNVCFVYQLCLSPTVRELFSARLVEMLNEVTCLATNIVMGQKKKKKEFYHKGFVLSSLLYKLEVVYNSKPLQYMRNVVERLWSDAEEKDFRLDNSKVALLLKSFLTEEVKQCAE